MKNVLILSSSPRINGNSDLLCKSFEKGAIEAGNNVEIVHLNKLHIGYCQGCYSCQNTGKCFQKDDMSELIEKVLKADVLVFASPVYFYSMSAQLKTFIDRLTPIYEQVRADIYIFVTAYDSNISNLENAVEAIRGLTRDCFESCKEKGVIMAGNVDKKGEIEGRKEILVAYNYGKNC
jgi:multimeric flavodoxin WrbA